MSKFDNRIYLTICESSMECFKKSKYINYTSYCSNMGLALRTNTLGNTQNRNLNEIIEMLDIIYSMDAKTTAKYLLDYFNSDKVRDFEKCIILIQETFPDLI